MLAALRRSSISAAYVQLPDHIQCACTLLSRRASSKRSKQGGTSGYDRLLQDWRRTQRVAVGQQRKARKHHHADGAWGGTPRSSTRRLWPAQEWLHQGNAAHHPHSRTSRRRSSSSSQDAQFPWSSCDYAAAAAGASRLSEEDLHNLFFDTGSSSSSRSARAAAKKLKRARRRQRQQAADAWQYWWEGGMSESDAEDEGSSHWGYAEDWKWWDDEQERAWLEQAWKERAAAGAGSSSGSSSSRHHSSNGQQQQSHKQQQQQQGHHTSGWWQHFRHDYYQRQQQQQQQQRHHRQHQQNKQQQQQQQQQQHTGSTSSSHHAGDSSSSGGMGGIRHTPSPEQVAHLQALGLPASLAALQRGRLKAAFLTAALQWHPDRHAGVAAKASAEARFKVVKEAYEALLPQAVA